ncbi:MAG: hypothetical protein AAFV85_13365 [Cyanobacteria bacterium J06634_6]
MTISPTITVKCPQCEHVYIGWHIPSVGTQRTQENSPSVSCSRCGYRVVLADLAEKDGVFQMEA